MKVCEIFSSIQGESTFAGLPCTFIRLTGCNLRCSYCDTRYAYHEGRDMPFAEILGLVEAAGIGIVEITGGEPLLQRNEVDDLCGRLLDRGYEVLIETNGSLGIRGLDERVRVILDLKTPGSGMEKENEIGNLDLLKETDEVKFVLCGRDDYLWAKDLVAKHGLSGHCSVLFSPAYGFLDPRLLAGWLIEDRLKVRFNLQIHKYIFKPEERMV